MHHARIIRSARLALGALIALAAVFGSFACRPGGHVEVPAQPPVSGDLAAVLSGARLAQYQHIPADDNRLDDTPARADDDSRLAAQLASETGMAHINDVARRVRYNGAYFEIDIEVNREHGVVPVTWDMLRAHTPLVSQAYYARVYTSRGWENGRQAPSSGPGVILPEAFTPELTPELFEYFKRSFIRWNRDFDGWTQAMAEAWLKTAAIHVARAFTPESVGGVAVISARASQITGRTALGAAAVPNAAVATRACAGGRCLPAASRGALTSLDDMAGYVAKHEKLPENFITKAEAKALGWRPKAGNLAEVAPGKSIGGDVFKNSEGLLPSAPGRVWYEADIGYTWGFRGSERLLYSNDGLMFRTVDHYKTFIPIP